MPFQTLAMTDLPKREAPVREFDSETANAILAIISNPGQTATDGVVYADQKKARTEANKTKRLVNKVVPDGKVVETRLFGLDGDKPVSLKAASTFGYCVFLTDAPNTETADEAAADKPSKSKK